MRLNCTFLLLLLSSVFLSCHSPGPIPERTHTSREPVTSIGLVISNDEGFCDTFVYKTSTRASAADPQPYGETIMLTPYSTYHVSILLLDERPDSTRDVTRQIVAGADSHLFLFRNTPLYSPGIIVVDNGNRDHDGMPFNQRVQFRTGATGNSVMNLQLLHNPSSKKGDWKQIRGSLDAKASYPVVITNFNPRHI